MKKGYRSIKFWNTRTNVNIFLGVIVIIILLLRSISGGRYSGSSLWRFSFWIFLLCVFFFTISGKILTGKHVGGSRWKRAAYTFAYHSSTIISLFIVLLMIWPWMLYVLKRISLIEIIYQKVIQWKWLSTLLHNTILIPYTVDPYVAIAWGFLFSVDLCFLQHRWTYRVLPNLFISGAFFIMFCIIVSAQFGAANIFGMEIMTPERMAPFITDSFTKWLGFGTIGAVISTFVGKATEDIWYGMSRSSTGDYAKVNYRFKLQRRKLLTYKENAFARMTRIGFLQIIFLAIVVFTGVLLFFTKKGDIQRFLAQLYFIGTAMAIAGFALHQFITDGHLLRAENDYIFDRREAAENSWDIIEKPCQEASWEWTCYCQTLANIFCSRSPIFHENISEHNAELLERRVRDNSSSICPVRIIADLVYMFDEQFSLYCCEEAKAERLGIELQIADTISQYFCNSIDDNNIALWSENTYIFSVIIQIISAYMAAAKGILVIIGTSHEDIKLLLFLDYLRYLVRYKAESEEGKNVCHLHWLCQTPNATELVNTRRTRCERMRQLFPYEALNLLIQRWGKENILQSDSSNYWRTYLQLIDNYKEKWNNRDDYWIQLSQETKTELGSQVVKYQNLYQVVLRP